MNITINNYNIELKYSIRALMMYENIKEETFSPSNITNIVTFMYCIIVSSAKDYSITLDDVLDAIDENNNLLKEFTEWLAKTTENQNKLKKD